MAHYDVKILESLLDSYERSLLSKGKNKVTIHIAFPFTKKTIPEYFNESSLAYDEIHGVVRELEQRGFLEIVWKKGKEGHIVQKVLLKEGEIEKVYAYLRRTPKADYIVQHLQLLDSWKQEEEEGFVVWKFVDYLKERIQEGKTVKEFVDLPDLEKTKRILTALSCKYV